MVPEVHSFSPCPTGACSTVGARARPPARPNSYRHFTARYKASSRAQVGGAGVLLVLATDGCCRGQARAAKPVVSEGPPPHRQQWLLECPWGSSPGWRPLVTLHLKPGRCS